MTDIWYAEQQRLNTDFKLRMMAKRAYEIQGRNKIKPSSMNPDLLVGGDVLGDVPNKLDLYYPTSAGFTEGVASTTGGEQDAFSAAVSQVNAGTPLEQSIQESAAPPVEDVGTGCGMRGGSREQNIQEEIEREKEEIRNLLFTIYSGTPQMINHAANRMINEAVNLANGSHYATLMHLKNLRTELQTSQLQDKSSVKRKRGEGLRGRGKVADSLKSKMKKKLREVVMKRGKNLTDLEEQNIEQILAKATKEINDILSDEDVLEENDAKQIEKVKQIELRVNAQIDLILKK